MSQKHAWAFRSRFRTRAFGWKGSKLAVQRIKEAVKEIRKEKAPLLRAEGAILLLERLWPALQQIDSSSGSLGNATYNAVHELVQFIIDAPAEEGVRSAWLDRLWEAMEEDGVDYLYEVSERWGELCADPAVASHWADILRPTFELSWKKGGYFRGGPACLSCLLQAQRHDELLTLIDQAPYLSWSYRKYGVKALAALDKAEEAISYAQSSLGQGDGYSPIAAACEKILIGAGRPEEAYSRFAISATTATTNLACYRSLAKRYPQKAPQQILRDLIASTPGEEGKWFATAKSLGHFDLAAALARQSPVNIGTLNRAARDFMEEQPAFALEAALASLHWLAAGEFYEITAADVYAAVSYACAASIKVGCLEETRKRITDLVDHPHTNEFVRQQLMGALGRR